MSPVFESMNMMLIDQRFLDQHDKEEMESQLNTNPDYPFNQAELPF